MAVQGDPAEDAFASLQEVWGGHSRSDSDITYRGHGDEVTLASAAATLSPTKGGKHSRAPNAESAATSSQATVTIPPIRLTSDLVTPRGSDANADAGPSSSSNTTQQQDQNSGPSAGSSTGSATATAAEESTFGSYPPPQPKIPQLKVLIIGAGPAGLINARTLVDDGFHVTIIFKVSSSFRLQSR
jgi:hypothetical protein